MNNISFTSNLYYGDIAGSKKRWANIAQTFHDNTRYNRYEQRLGSCYDVHIYHDEKNRLTIQASNAADSFEPRECILTKDGEKNLLNLSDNKIAEKIEKLLDLVINRDKTIKERDAILEELKQLDGKKYLVIKSEYYNRPNNPPMPVMIVKLKF